MKDTDKSSADKVGEPLESIELGDDVELIPLLAALAWELQDPTLLRDALRQDFLDIRQAQGGLSPSAIRLAKQLARDALSTLAKNRSPKVDKVDHESRPVEIPALLEFMLSKSYNHNYDEMLTEELCIDGKDLRRPDFTLSEFGSIGLSATVIGAGMSGLLIALRLRQAGIDVTILEKGEEPAGTWSDNSYPGCRVDVPSHLYSYSFHQKPNWPQHFSAQPELRRYFCEFSARHGLTELIEFNSEVTQATFDSSTNRWHTQYVHDGLPKARTSDLLISAVGQLNIPNYPAIEGADSFAGPNFHSARWSHQVNLGNKRVGVIGTGASAAQLIPEIAKQAAKLVIFQRTPNWLAPTPTYLADVSASLAQLMDEVPSLAGFYRVWLLWKLGDDALLASMVEDGFSNSQTSVGSINEEVRRLLSMYLMAMLADRPDLLEKSMPQYPPTAKRIIRDAGVWTETLKAPNVELVVDPIASITATAVQTEHLGDNQDYELDVLIYATGFKANEFLTPIRVKGTDGDLNKYWAGDARAFKGITVPGFPNFFMLYGPNTNIVINGSIIFFSECEARYILSCVKAMLEAGATSIDTTQDAHQRYAAWIDDGNLNRAWGVSEVNSWYKSSSGRSAQNWPYGLLDYWSQTRHVDPADHIFT